MKHKLLALLIALGVCSPLSALALEAKKPIDVDLSALASDGQRVVSNSGQINFVWWIPHEFWQASLARQNIPEDTKKGFLDNLRPYVILAVVQSATSNPATNPVFLPHDQVEANVSVMYEDGQHHSLALNLVKTPTGPMATILNTITPVMTNMAGALGKGMQFLVFNNTAGDGSEIVSAEAQGKLTITLTDPNGTKLRPADIYMPMNSLFIPRICADGREANVTWKYCPWDGSKLPD